MSTQPTASAKKTSSNHLSRQVAQYSIAAAVAGVSMLALAAPAAGEVVVTRKTIPVPLTTLDALEPVKVSMANNGIDDFRFYLAGDTGFRFLWVDRSNSSNGVIPSATYPATAKILPRAAKIGPSADFRCCYVDVIEHSFTNTDGPRKFSGQWGGNPQNSYLGVRFLLNGQTHYGWIRLTVSTYANAGQPYMSAKITGYAYETVPNKPILAGTAATVTSASEKPTAKAQAPKNIKNQAGPSLGMLAAGADALPVWRREEISLRQ